MTTFLFFLLIGLAIAFLTSIDSGETAVLFQEILLVVAFVLAAIVVRSDRVPWIGDD